MLVYKFLFKEQFHHTFYCTWSIVTINSEMEIHFHHSEFVSLFLEMEIKWRFSFRCWLEVSENCFRIPENIFRPNEASHSSFDANDCSFCDNGSWSRSWVIQFTCIFAGSPRSVMRQKYPKTILNHFGGSSSESSIYTNGSNCPIYGIIKFKWRERECIA